MCFECLVYFSCYSFVLAESTRASTWTSVDLSIFASTHCINGPDRIKFKDFFAEDVFSFHQPRIHVLFHLHSTTTDHVTPVSYRSLQELRRYNRASICAHFSKRKSLRERIDTRHLLSSRSASFYNSQSGCVIRQTEWSSGWWSKRILVTHENTLLTTNRHSIMSSVKAFFQKWSCNTLRSHQVENSQQVFFWKRWLRRSQHRSEDSSLYANLRLRIDLNWGWLLAYQYFWITASNEKT